MHLALRANARSARSPRRASHGRCASESLEPRTLLAVAPSGMETRVNTFTANALQAESDIAADAAGNSVVVWQGDRTGSGSAYGIFGRRYGADGAPQGSVFQVNTTSAGTRVHPAVAMDADGDFVVAWQSYTPTSTPATYIRRFNASGVAQGGEVRLVQATQQAPGVPAVAFTGDGGFVVAFVVDGMSSGQNLDFFDIWLQRFDAAGATVGLSRVVTTAPGDQYSPGLAAAGDGGFLVTWAGNGGTDPSQRGVFARRFDAAGEPQGPDVQLSATPVGANALPAVAARPGGGYAVAWQDQPPAVDPPPYEPRILGRLLDGTGAPETGEVMLGLGLSPDVAVGSDGNALFTWDRFSYVYARELFPSGAPDGGAGIITPRAGANAALAARPGGNFLLTFDRYDTLSRDVYLQPLVSFAPSTVSGVVWTDADGDGVRSAAESLVAGVTVNLLDAGGFAAATTQTGADGTYRFEVLKPGESYAVEFVAPQGRVFSARGRGSDAAADSDADAAGRTVAFAAPPPGAADVVLDAGLTLPGGISGTVGSIPAPAGGWSLFLDSDGDGQFDASEPTVSADRVTGAYRFTGLTPGVEYVVCLVPQTHWQQTFPATPDGAHRVTVQPDRTVTGYDFTVRTDVPDTAAPPQPELTVHPAGAGRQFHARVASDADGDFVVAWEQVVGPNDVDVYARRFDRTGLPRGAAFRVNTFTANQQGSPDVAMDPAGDFVVVWQSDVQEGAGTLYGIYGQRYSAAGERVGGEFHVNATTAGSQEQASVSMADDGRFVVDWGSAVGLPAGVVFAQRFGADGAKAGGQFRVSTSTTPYQQSPSVAVDADGDFVVAWQSGYPQTGVSAQRYNAAGVRQGGEFSPADVPNDVGTPSRYGVYVGVDADGNFAATWTEVRRFNDGSYSYAVVRRFDANGVPQGGPADVAQSAQNSSIAVARDGSFVVVYEQPFASPVDWEVFGRRYNAAGVAQGAPFRLNAPDAPGDQIFPAVASDGAGNFVATWASEVAFSSYTVMARPFGDRHEAPPRALSVTVSNGEWPTRFLEDGYAIPDDGAPHAAGRPPQLDPLPWGDVDRVVVRFTRGVQVGRDDLRVTGTAVNAYGVSDFSYDPQTATAVWTLDRPVGADRLDLHLDAGPDGVRGSDNGLALDGEWSDGASAFPSGDGAPGGDFAFRINVLPGDATRDGVVNALDLAQIKRRLFRRPGDGVVGAAAYSPFADVTGDRIINALDLGAIKLRLNSTLPAPPPAAAAPSAGESPAFASSVTRDLFALAPVLD